MTFGLSVAAKNAALNAAFDLMDAGAGAGTIKFYTTPRPATADTAITSQTLLATLTCADPAFAAAASGSKAIDADPDLTVNAVASGVCVWARCADSTGAVVGDGDVGTSGTDIVVNTTTFTSGQPVTITSGTIS